MAFYGTDDPGWIVESQCDLRVGGLWTVTFGPSRDYLYHHRNVFEVIDRPRRLVVATTELRPDRPTFDFSAEFTFEEQDGQTLMTIIQSGFPTPELRDEHQRPGWMHFLREVFTNLPRPIAAALTIAGFLVLINLFTSPHRIWFHWPVMALLFIAIMRTVLRRRRASDKKEDR